MSITQTVEDFVSFDETLAAITTKRVNIMNEWDVNNDNINNIMLLHLKPLQNEELLVCCNHHTTFFYIIQIHIAELHFNSYEV